MTLPHNDTKTSGQKVALKSQPLEANMLTLQVYFLTLKTIVLQSLDSFEALTRADYEPQWPEFC